MNIGPGNVIGAMAVGGGATVRGSVTVGATTKPVGALRLKFKARHMTRAEMASALEAAARDIRGGEADVGASGAVPGASYAWSIEGED